VAALEVVLLAFHLVAEAEPWGQLAGSFIYVVRHRIEHRHAQKMTLDPVFQMNQDKMIPVIAFGTSLRWRSYYANISYELGP
jgi:hypothetical protein